MCSETKFFIKLVAGLSIAFALSMLFIWGLWYANERYTCSKLPEMNYTVKFDSWLGCFVKTKSGHFTHHSKVNHTDLEGF